jgi:hypothetical protein
MAHKSDDARGSFLANFLQLEKGFAVVSWELLGLGALVGSGAPRFLPDVSDLAER